MFPGLLESPAHLLAAFALGTLRMAVLLIFCPIGQVSGIAWQMRMVIAGALSLVCLPMTDPAQLAGMLGPLTLSGLLLKEALVGALLGMLLGMPFWVAEGMGVLFDNHRGAMTGSQFNALITSPSPLAALMQLSAILLMYQTGGAAWVMDLFTASIDLWPPASLRPIRIPVDAQTLVSAFNQMAQGMVVYYLPLMAALIIVEAGLAVVSLYASTLQVFQLAMPIKSAVGLLLFVLFCSVFWQSWNDQLLTHLRQLLSMAGHV